MPETLKKDLGIDKVSSNLHHEKNTDFASEKLLEPLAFPVEVLPKSCQKLVQEAVAAISCPPDFVALPMLVVLGTAVGNSRVIKLKGGWEEGAAIYGAVVADPGEKKTPAMKLAIEPAAKEQAALRDAYRKKVDEYKRECREYEVEKKDARDNGLPAPPPPQEPMMKRTLVEDTTVEALAVVLEGTPRGVLAMRDELSGWARSMDQYKTGGRGADRQFYLSAWSNTYASVDRKSKSEPLILGCPFIGVVGTIQPDVLSELGAGREDGLLDRFLFAYPTPKRSRWSDDEISVEARAAYKDLYDGLRNLHMPEEDHGEPDPVRVALAPDAKEVFKQAINELREEMEAPGFSTRLKGPWSKLEAYLCRLSLILALCRSIDAMAPERVEARDVTAAMALLNYFKTHIRRVHIGLHGQDPNDLLAMELARFLYEQGGEWKGEPSELHEELSNLAGGVVPERPDELSKRVRALSKRVTWLRVGDDEWGKKEGKSHRVLHLHLQNGVGSVVRVDS